MIGIICPSSFEYKALRHAKLKKQEAVLLLSGMGKLRAAYACGDLERAQPKLRGILLVGFAGGLTSHLTVGDVIEPHIFIEQDYNAEPFEKFPNLVRRKSPKLLKDSCDGLMLTQDRFLKENPYKNSDYAKRHKRIACDMESYAVASFCQRRKLPYAVIKLISDSADETADHDFLKACKQLSPKLSRVVSEALRVMRRRIKS